MLSVNKLTYTKMLKTYKTMSTVGVGSHIFMDIVFNTMGKIKVKKRKERQPDRREEGEKGERMQIRQTR